MVWYVAYGMFVTYRLAKFDDLFLHTDVLLEVLVRLATPVVLLSERYLRVILVKLS